MSVLLKTELRRRLREKEITKRLVVTPLLDPNQVGASSIDVRLGNEFILIHKTRFPSLDLRDKGKLPDQVQKYQTRLRIEYKQEFVLHPGQLVLGATLEYLRLPNDLTCYVIGRSSWGRLGLVIATATAVGPGFRGSLTLEIVNVGEIPLVVYPGVRIAQLVFHTALGEGSYLGKHSCATGPEFSRIFEDDDLDWWIPKPPTTDIPENFP